MRTSTFSILLLPALAAGHVIQAGPRPASPASTSIIPTATAPPRFLAEANAPMTTSIVSENEILDLRQAPAAAAPAPAPVPVPAPAAPVVPGAAPPAGAPNPAAPNPAAPAPAAPNNNQNLQVNPNAGPLSLAPALDGQGGISVTVQWVETWIGGSIQTWVPVTATFRFAEVPTQGAIPGKGAIGMGTLTGQLGKTKTVALGAAPTMGGNWVKGAVVAAGVGLAGMVV